MVFMKYLGLMMARGHSIEFFIEGGRSRTGRLLQPKTGMLSMTLRSYLRDPRRPVVFVPVYFGYERLVEGKTYIGELSGTGEGEGIRVHAAAHVADAAPALRQGACQLRRADAPGGNPAPARAGLAREQGEKDDRPPWLAPAVDDLAARIMTNINSAACVTPMNLIALVLLATPKQSMLETDLVGSWSCMRRCCGRRRIRRSCGSRMPTAFRSCAMASAWASCSGTSIRSATCCR